MSSQPQVREPKVPVSLGQTASFEHIARTTASKVHVFLTELASGTSNYRSLHRLTQQVEHQYAGRFLIELVQNAHDALEVPSGESEAGRIAMLFDPHDSRFGSLLVANDGRPFTSSNFEKLSQLGQSDKDPQESIGNKGIGFRSVLEVTDAPEVYSRSSVTSSSFDGYCFGFDPSVVEALLEPILAMSVGAQVRSHLARPELMFRLQGEDLVAFRARVQSFGQSGVAEELKHLSPYLLPQPIPHIKSEAVRRLEREGYSTVVRLPVKSAAAAAYTIKKLAEFSLQTTLFLSKVGSLRLGVEGEGFVTFTRRATVADSSGTKRVALSDGDDSVATYAVWSREVQLTNAPEAVQAALRKLPDPWPKLPRAIVEVAVRLADEPETGCLCIFLPTRLKSGSAVHVQAPFFGDMSRTHIDFDDPFNRFLLETAADLVVHIARTQLARKGEAEARALIDLIAPHGDTSLGVPDWLELIAEAAKRASVSLSTDEIAFTERGWKALDITSRVPRLDGATVLTEEVLRAHATFEVFHPCLRTRETQLQALMRRMFPATGIDPLEDDLAATVAAAAQGLKDQGIDWNAFWRDAMRLLPTGQAELANHPILIGGDGLLHRASGGSTVFFVPRQGTPDDSDVDSANGTTDVPSSLRSAVAFLSEDVEVYVPNRAPPQQNALHKYLANGLVAQSRVETLFTAVLLKHVPTLPASLDGPDAQLCSDILHWALRLVDNADRRGRGADATLKHLGVIPVPCAGGWYPMSEASFGAGWDETSGALLTKYLDALSSKDAGEARRRVLLEPGAPEWKNGGHGATRWLRAGGVTDGLRLMEIRPETWKSEFAIRGSDCPLPAEGPEEFGAGHWDAYRTATANTVASPFSGEYRYQFGSFRVFPGMNQMWDLEESVRITLSELIVQSLPNWSKGLEPTLLVKRTGATTALRVQSPLRWLLEESPWLATHGKDGLAWSRLADRWHIPAAVLSNRVHQFSHLSPLPGKLAKRLDVDQTLASTLYGLGLGRYDMDEPSPSPKLIQALVAAIGSRHVSDANVLLGQIREAWKVFAPLADQAPFKTLPVRLSDRRLVAHAPTAEDPVYLPDLGTYVSDLEAFGKPVLAIQSKEAKSLRPWFVQAYGNRIVPTSTLSLVPRVGDSSWDGTGAVPLVQDRAGWLIGPLLTLAAFCGAAPGVHAASFRDSANLLQACSIQWVTELRLDLQQDGRTLLTATIDAFWHGARRTLIVSDVCRLSPDRLSTALVQLLEREDLDLPLQFMLEPLESIENEPPDLVAFLRRLKLSGEQVYQVLEYLRGDVTQSAKLLCVLVTLADPLADVEPLRAALTEDEVRRHLETVSRLPIEASLALRLAREGHDFFDFGKQLSELMPLSLPAWNEALLACRYPAVSNQSWKSELRAALEEASGLVKRALAHIQRATGGLNFRQAWTRYSGLVSSVDLALEHWEVRFCDAMSIVASLMEEWGAKDLASAISTSSSAADFQTALVRSGVDVMFDPDECARRNGELAEAIGRQLDRLRDAWEVKCGTFLAVSPESRPSIRVKLLTDQRMDVDGFLRPWSELDVLGALTAGVTADAHDNEFWESVTRGPDLESARRSLGLTEADVAFAEERLALRKADAARIKRLVRVCGADFDSDPDNLSTLWSFLSVQLPDSEVNGLPPLTLSTPLALEGNKTKRKSPRQELPKTGSHPPRQSKAMDELVGLAGEILVYRRLQTQYGAHVISPSAWVSENSRRAFPSNAGDDSAGYDIGFTVKGVTYRVEVKATAGDDDSFSLGSSEIRLAQELGLSKKRNRAVYLIAHVKHALAGPQTFAILPNPFDPKFAGLFDITDRDARLRYRRAN